MSDKAILIGMILFAIWFFKLSRAEKNHARKHKQQCPYCGKMLPYRPGERCPYCRNIQPMDMGKESGVALFSFFRVLKYMPMFILALVVLVLLSEVGIL